MRPKGSSAESERRRRLAVAMLRRGMKPDVVAKTLRTSLVSVGRWREACRVGGIESLAAKPSPGRPLKLGPVQRLRVHDLLRKGPTHHGFATEFWTLARVAEVIEIHFGVTYHPSQVWRILLSMGWSCQKPESRARERDEDAIARWRRRQWPRLKKSREFRAKRAVSG